MRYQAKVKAVYDIAPLDEYIAFLQNKIPLYVFSLTKNSDSMDMWNYYGNGGAQFIFSNGGLPEELACLLKTDDDHLSFASVHYVADSAKLEDISLPAFSSFRVSTKNKKDLFGENEKEQLRLGQTTQLYQTQSLKIFVDTYIRNYLKSIETLLGDGTITLSGSPEEIFTAIFDNTMALTRKMLWKKDLTLYMLILSALIKADTYSYEREQRVVYFETTLTPPRSCNVEYTVQSLQGQKYVKPYIETDELDLSSIESVVLSPLTKNLSLDTALYTQVLHEFLQSKLGRSIPVNISKHKIRW